MVIDAKLPPKDAEDQSIPIPPPSYPSASAARSYESPPSNLSPPPMHSLSRPAYPQSAYDGSQGQYLMSPAYVNMGAQYHHQLLARCAQGDHDVTTTFGLCGIICAVLLFPFGLICLCLDSEKKCARCGVRLE